MDNNLRVERARKRISQFEASRGAGFESFNRYWRVENGQTEPTADERAALAAFFDCHESALFPSLSESASEVSR